MKKILSFFAFVACVVASYAANPVKLTNGDKAIFSEAVIANVEIDDHKTIIDGKDQTADVYYGNQSQEEYDKFIEDVDRGHESFITYFNEKKGNKIKLKMAGADADATYTLKVNVTSMNVGNAGGVVWGLSRKAGGALINGTMQLVNNASGEVACEFEFEGVKGLMAPIFKARVISVYRYLADGLIKAL